VIDADVKTSIYRLIVPRWHPARLNQFNDCRWTRARLKKKDRLMIWIESRLQGIPPAVGRRRISLHIVMAPKKRKPDPDAFWKSLCDALVKADRLVDDNSRWCELGPVTFGRGPEASTVITLEDIGEPAKESELPKRRRRAKHGEDM
jgi:hypothetical protein